MSKNNEIVQLLFETLEINHVSPDLQDFYCFESIKKRVENCDFEFKDHLKGVVFALLASQRPWDGIKKNFEKICDIFNDFNDDLFEHTSQDEIIKNIIEIKCGNKNIRRQIYSLPYVIDTLKELESKYGTIDAFITHDHPKAIALLLVQSKEYKLKGLGPSLVFDYLRNVGIDIAKPDTHLMRLFGSERLGFINKINANQFEVVEMIDKLANELNMSPAVLGTTFWMLCAKGYGNICGATPKCNCCRLKERICSFTM